MAKGGYYMKTPTFCPDAQPVAVGEEPRSPTGGNAANSLNLMLVERVRRLRDGFLVCVERAPGLLAGNAVNIQAATGLIIPSSAVGELAKVLVDHQPRRKISAIEQGLQVANVAALIADTDYRPAGQRHIERVTRVFRGRLLRRAAIDESLPIVVGITSMIAKTGLLQDGWLVRVV
jgi:hypothetical protein